jgi:hypothetical protein
MELVLARVPFLFFHSPALPIVYIDQISPTIYSAIKKMSRTEVQSGISKSQRIPREH